MQTAQAVTPGQGQTVNVAGVEVGEIKSVKLEDGARDHRHEDRAALPARLQGRDGAAAAQDRPEGHGRRARARAPRPRAGCPRAGGSRVSQTLPDVNLDEILAALDADTRDYLTLLLSDGGEALKGNGRELGNTIRRIEPTAKLSRQRQRGAGRARPRTSSARSTTSRC